MRNDYSDPRWRIKAHERLRLDGWQCQKPNCPNRGKHIKLNVHHKIYYPGRAIWDYPLEDLETRCEGCHIEAHKIINLDSRQLLFHLPEAA